MIVFNDKLVQSYFNIKDVGYLKIVKGSFYPYDGTMEDVIFIGDNDSVIKAQYKLQSLKHLGNEYEKVYITYVPAKELEYYYNHKFEKYCSIPNTLIKTKIGDIKCYLSGRRSCIFIQNNIAYRLKGCGNEYIGFNLEKVIDISSDHLEIRGSQFKNTCLREQYMTNIINKLLEKNDMLPGNIPIGFYIYSTDIDKETDLVNEAKLIEKYCGLFTTNGDKRLGNNLFKGINNLVRKLFLNNEYSNNFFSILDFQAIVNNLPNKNYNLHDDGSIEILFNDRIYDNKDLLFDFMNYIIDMDLAQSEENIIGIKDDELITNLFENLKIGKKSIINTLIILLSRLSYEIGKVNRIFKESNINWGTYDYHCNAHLDNFIILPKNNSKNLLAPVDFDLCFTRDQFIEYNYINKKGIENKLNFDDLLEREKNCLLFQLIGINMIPNIEVNVLNIDDIEDINFKNFISLLRENMALYFYKGYEISIFEYDYDTIYDLSYLTILLEN